MIRIATYISCLVLMLGSCNQLGKKKSEKVSEGDDSQQNESKVLKGDKNNKLKDTIIWKPYISLILKRMFYGPVKSSEEVMTYMAKMPNGKFIKINKTYYKSGAFPNNFKVEFDSLGRMIRYDKYTLIARDEDPERVGFEYEYNDKDQLVKEHFLQEDDLGFFTTKGYEYTYDANGRKKYRLLVHHTVDYSDRWTEDSITYEFNNQGDLVKSTSYRMVENDGDLVLQDDFHKYRIQYKYDSQGRVIEKKEGNQIERFIYQNGKLHTHTRTISDVTDEYIYYPTGIVKSANLRTRLVVGDFRFNTTGDILVADGRKVADYSEYDEHGNWTKRIIYKTNGDPHTYTERKIEYYE
ncbi:hypothetical protein M0D21_15985 [Aquimarina sp. D1M17]|uniref:hypothetical protein n=1 Tax=Aquimarina acroporae TaxID=2937283 RepID=UPI0020BD8817|nr:hypothetical protein [Aquimarina acroporae]MCK8523078.1 hypothetical protein [Aquimarina acroporae]